MYENKKYFKYNKINNTTVNNCIWQLINIGFLIKILFLNRRHLTFLLKQIWN